MYLVGSDFSKHAEPPASVILADGTNQIPSERVAGLAETQGELEWRSFSFDIFMEVVFMSATVSNIAVVSI